MTSNNIKYATGVNSIIMKARNIVSSDVNSIIVKAIIITSSDRFPLLLLIATCYYICLYIFVLLTGYNWENVKES